MPYLIKKGSIDYCKVSEEGTVTYRDKSLIAILLRINIPYMIVSFLITVHGNPWRRYIFNFPE